MQPEYDQLVNDQMTWEIRSKPENAKAISRTWVYEQKEGPTVKGDEVEKARVCAQGDSVFIMRECLHLFVS